jgi:hypothetical protein
MDGTTYLNVELLVSQSLSTSSQPCNENASVYDKCVFDEYLAKLSRTNSCLLPFLPQHFAPEISYCNNFSLAIKSLKQFQNLSSTCIASCQLVITDLSIQLEDQYLSNSLTRSIFANTGERQSLYLLLPKNVNFIESKQYYTLFSALAEFLGIAGLFFGISAFSFANIVIAALDKLFHIIHSHSNMFKFWYLKTSFLILFGLTSLGIVLWILIEFIEKYLSYPVGSHVTLVAGIPYMSMALCRSKYMTTYNFWNKSYQSITEDIDFWLDGVDIRTKIIYLSAMNTNGDWTYIWDTSIFDERIFSKLTFPLDNQTLQFCDIIELHNYKNLAKVGYDILCIYLDIFLQKFSLDRVGCCIRTKCLLSFSWPNPKDLTHQ